MAGAVWRRCRLPIRHSRTRGMTPPPDMNPRPQARQRLGRKLAPILLLAVVSLPGQQVQYREGDWDYIPFMAAITSASDGDEQLLFSTLDGLWGYDYLAGRLYPLIVLNAGLPDKAIQQVYQDAQTRAIWVVHEAGVSFRLPVDGHWRHISRAALPDFFVAGRVRRLGGSPAGIWLDSDGVYTLLSSFTGAFISRDTAPPPGAVDWNVSSYDFPMPIVLTTWFGAGDWLVTLNGFEGPGLVSARPLFQIEDRQRYIWLATDLGLLFRGDPYSRQLSALPGGIAPARVTTIYRDGDLVWFADSPFRRTGRPAVRSDDYFLSAWDERASRWRYYRGTESESIAGTGVNSMLRVGSELWLATMQGIVILHTRSGEWRSLRVGSGLNDAAVWDLVTHDGLVFAATARGINRIDPRRRIVLPADSSHRAPPVAVYTLISTGTRLLAGTEAGIYEYNGAQGRGWRRTSNRVVTAIVAGTAGVYAAAGRQIFVERRPGAGYELLSLGVPIEGRILGMGGFESYIWLATTEGALAYDERTRKAILLRSGLGSRAGGLPDNFVYEVLPDADRVWLVTRRGVARFDWRFYFE